MGYRVELDLTQCQGYANCLIEASDLFDFDDEANKAILKVAEPSDELRAQADNAVRGCPARAISVVERDA
ncbi:ferredoxin [Enemella sp. A6]|uniref:ferredoxin n=1 Tax=Enemella sp. A6 TaxID=3440152 RepID=UPI003EBCCA29